MGLLSIPGLSPADQATLDELLNQLEAKMPRNQLRAQYYDGKNLFKDLGISTPPKFRNFEAVLGWPSKAVDSLSRRCILEGFVLPGGSAADLGVDQIWDDNNMDVEAPQAHDSSLIHSCAFITTIRGDTSAGEPPVMMMVRDAFNATGLWDTRRRMFTAGLSVVDRDCDSGSPIRMVMYLPDRVLTISRDVVGGRWAVAVARNPMNRVLMEPLVFRPRLGRPMGRSRISRPVMYLTDAAIRTVVRSEIGAEFFTAPQRYGLNIPNEAFESGGWNAVLGRFLNVSPPTMDEDADPNFQPQVGQFTQMSMQPHTEQLRQWATLFAGETSLPVSSLGIVQDNPSSAEALYASKEELVIEAEAAARGFGVGWTRAMRNAIMLRDGLTEMPDELRQLRVKWRDPSTPSKAAAADAMTKIISVMPWIAESEVALEKLGFDRTDIERLVADKRKANVADLLQSMRSLAAPQQEPPPAAPDGDQAPVEPQE